ncbi:MAG: hypothetical protein SGPRY_009927, partial [Prymnesium sp.]
IATSGEQSTSSVAEDKGVLWLETSSWLSANISIPGLIGQPVEVCCAHVSRTLCDSLLSFLHPAHSILLPLSPTLASSLSLVCQSYARNDHRSARRWRCSSQKAR